MECAGSYCHNKISPKATGRPAKYCSDRCRNEAHRAREQHKRPVRIQLELTREQYDRLREAAGPAWGADSYLASRLIVEGVDRLLS